MSIVNIAKQPFLLGIIAVVVIAAAVSSYFYIQYRGTQSEIQKLKEDPKGASAEETKKLVEQVGKLVELPTGEDPTVATVTDKERLKDQAFFARAENGDKVLIYTQAKKAYLYRPSSNKIIDVAPVNIGTSSAQAKSVRVAIYNGTSTVGLTNTIEKQIKEKIANIEVVAKENASKKDYTKTIVVDLVGNEVQAQQLADILGGQVEDLPQGEKKPNADFLVILGK